MEEPLDVSWVKFEWIRDSAGPPLWPLVVGIMIVALFAMGYILLG